MSKENLSPEEQHANWKAPEVRGTQWPSKTRQLSERVLNRIQPHRAERQQQAQLLKRIIELHQNVKFLPYAQGEGITTGVSRRLSSERPAPNIEAPGFRDCCAVVLQAPDGVAIVHISPLVENSDYNPVVDYQGEVRKSDYHIHINSALQKLASKGEREYDILKPEQEAPVKLNPEQVKYISENVKMTVIGGSEILAGIIRNQYSNPVESFYTKTKANISIPKIGSTEVLYGNGPKTVLANMNEIYVLEEAGSKIIKVK